tara:strand:+ start:80 stop:322 length:243 start_codon:yes stop_codon:yes gene_type:complete
MVNLSEIIGNVSSLLSSSQDFVIWLVVLPITFIVVVTLILYKNWDSPPDFAKSFIFKVLYIVVFYAIAVAIISLIYGLVN